MSAEPVAELDRRHERACLVALSALDGVGPATIRACATTCGAATAWEALQSGRAGQIAALVGNGRRNRPSEVLHRLAQDASAIDAEVLLAQHESAGQTVVAFGEPGYPVRLLEDPAPPSVLFLAGSDAALAGPTVAIVGTRNATRLGRDTAGSLAAELAQRGVSIVSGLALGIDGAAHQALVSRELGAAPIGVIATGLEQAYPRRHRTLQDQVVASGLLVSESPIGSEPTRWRFPARNRIIAGLADAVVVVESRSAGGSMLTAAEAVARDRPVLAVPGHPTSPASAGTLDLIADGAVPVRDVEDVLVAIGCGGRKPVAAPVHAVPAPLVSPTAAVLLEVLDGSAQTLGELMLVGPFSLGDASAALFELEGAGLVVRSGAWFERAGPVTGRSGTRPGR